MPELRFAVEAVEIDRYAVAPVLLFKLRITSCPATQPVQSIVLRSQLAIDGNRRGYSPQEHARLAEHHGDPDRGRPPVSTLYWTHVTTIVPSFEGSTKVDLAAPCTFDFNVAATRYFCSLDSDDVPVSFLFSGTMFCESGEKRSRSQRGVRPVASVAGQAATTPLQAVVDGPVNVEQIPWGSRAEFSLPVKVWRNLMDFYYPDGAWLQIRQDILSRLAEFKLRRRLPTWERALDELLLNCETAATS